VREAVFSIIAGRIAGAMFVDLFAGSGAMGIEALSRGAGAALFVDGARDCGRAIRENLKTLGVGGGDALVLDADISGNAAPALLAGGIKRLGRIAADVIYADPPYGYGGIEGLPLTLADAAIIAPDGALIVEHGKNTKMPRDCGSFEKADERKYGDTRLSIYKMKI
jgi:16S rRNA (guanine(966)-N(2))-methyltransferase RsmD